MSISSLTTGHGMALQNSSAGWQPNMSCSHWANTWSRLGSMRLIS